MRKDIEIHINTGDITLLPRNNFTLQPFEWVDNAGGQLQYIYGEITLPNISETSIRKNGIHVQIPYTPTYKEFCVRIKRKRNDGEYVYLLNPTNNSEWYVVKAVGYNGEHKRLYASELFIISEGTYYLHFNNGTIELYSSAESDFNIIKVNKQNSNLLLKCVPTNNYRYPTSGVGLVRWLNSNIDQDVLASVLKREFEADGVRVNNAAYDFETNDLYLDLNTQTIDNDGNT